AVGAELAGLMGAVIPLVIGMPDDHGPGYHEEGAGLAAQKALLEELNGRAFAIYYREFGKGYLPEWKFVYEMAVHEKYLEMGLDKHKDLSSKYGPAHLNLELGSPAPIYSASQMHAR